MVYRVKKAKEHLILGAFFLYLNYSWKIIDLFFKNLLKSFGNIK
jgi:hypothetical protein